ncbi:MAG: BMP family ABC transporter substrate-binding protein, partial [Clostridia bacterium]|nr:BMP family ABC transporter substrate-binding protein [Clostridia bacterium]
MKKLVIAALLLCLLMMAVACNSGTTPEDPTEAPTTEAPVEEKPTETQPVVTEPVNAFDPTAWKVAMVTDYGDITDQSFNQTTYEAGKAWCEEMGVDFTYYKPTGDSTAERVAMIEMAVAEGYNVILLPGYAFGDAIAETADLYPEVYYIALDVGEGDFGGYVLPENVFSAVYQEELWGYMAGYAAVKLGYKHLAFLGGMAVPAVVRYGYGFVQGVDAAAVELGIAGEVVVDYVYGNQFFGDADITAYMDTLYAGGLEVTFACGGGIFTSAGEA